MNRATELFADLDRARPIPLRTQLERAVCDAIAGGGLRPGDRLPASRTLAEAAGVSRGVVSEAYAQLAAEGWVDITRGRAPVVRATVAAPVAVRRDRAAPPSPRLDLTATAPDLARFPRREVGAALRRALAEMPDAALDYGDPLGDGVLREELAAYLVRVCGIAASPERVAVTNGYTQGLWLACRALAARGGRRVAVEDPSLDDSWATIRSAGLEVVGVPVDGDGARVGGAEADAFLVTPAHQFPTGAVLSPERRRALLEWAAAGDRIVLEDDYDTEYAYDRAPVRTLQRLAPERVVYLGTASKTLAPALRLGWMVVPEALAEAVARERWAVDSGGPAITARAYARLLASGDVDRHLRRTRLEYRRRRDRLVGELETLPGCRVEGAAAGLHLLLRLPPGTDEDAVVAQLARRRIRIRGLGGYRLAAPARPDPALVVGYGRLPLAAIGAVAAALREAIGSAAGPAA